MAQHDYDLTIRARRAIVGDDERAVEIGVSGGRIAAVADPGAGLDAERAVELAEDEVLLPGLVDSHVHVNEPGRTEWEGFATATRAAAAGGVTTIVDMPLNSVPPTTTVDGLHVKRAVARDQVAVDVGFWGGAVPENTGPETAAELRALHEEGVYGFKSFLSPSGVDEFGHLSPEEFRAAVAAIGAFGGMIIVHAEDPQVLDAAPPAQGRAYDSFLASRPDEAEHAAIRLVIDTARATGTRSHILHLSTATALPLIKEAKDDGVPLTVETCPHYLTIAAEEVPAGATQFKCCPPIRGAANRDALWQALGGGLIDCVVSDHSPSTPDLKDLATGDFGTAWGGVSGLQVGFPAVWTEASARGYALSDVVRWMARRPAEIAGVRGKGRLQVGYDADFAVVAPAASTRIDAATLQHKHPLSAYDGRELTGVVRQTWLRGQRVDTAHPQGRLLSRS
ncbi:allantoinase AllB [Nocardiopsis gilva YIM 90087]|uniref:allantoinase n=1 Tax=Nocardiopsis gilva YIM 90087 TaxID=1235441 RepID=A0A223SE13_9ACTN|nr:allantoinase AllB [Nocardiopsis gilva]ASU86336.1 allantoinase AllB [Nocardiopsis gilva YIM 90087]